MAIISNLIPNKLHPITGEDLKPTIVTTWRDGSPMTDALCGGLYNKDTESTSATFGNYFKWNSSGAYPISRLTTVNQSNFQKLINDFGSNATIILIDKSLNITSNITIPANITLKFSSGAVLNISSGIVVAFLSSINEADVQIFSGLGTITTINTQINLNWFGAVGDGVANDTLIIQKFLNISASKFLFGKDKNYGINNILTIANSNIELIGNNCTIKPLTTFTNNVVLINGKNNISIKQFTVFAGNDKLASCVSLIGCSNINIENNVFKEFGESGIKVTTSDNCKITRNTFLNAANNELFGLPSAADINIFGGNTNHVVTNNICNSGGGYGVHIRTFNNGDNNDNHLIKDNTITGYNSYGIMLYRNSQVLIDVPFQSVKNCIITDNTISDISGARPSDPASPSVLIFGAGIYLQGAEGSIVERNRISNTCINSNNELLAPGAIGLANIGGGIIANNKLYSNNRYGIYINDANSYGEVGATVSINNNIIDTCVEAGIKTIAKSDVSVSNNTIINSKYGIFITSSTLRSNFNFNNNVIKTISVSAISGAFCGNISITNNIIRDITLHGVSFNNCSDITIAANKIRSVTGRGVEIGASCSGINKVSNNTVQNSGSGGIGLFINAPCDTSSNMVESNSTNYAGTNIPFAIISSSATPDVKYVKTAILAPAGSTTFTNFLNGVLDQVIVLQATNANSTIQNNANIRLSGATDFVMSSNNVIALIKTAGIWIEIYRMADFNSTVQKLAITVPKTANYSIALTDRTVVFDATSGNLIGTLPTAASAFVNGIGQVYIFKKIDSSVNTVTIDGNGSEVIDGAANQVLITQWQKISIQSNGTSWYVL